jgi:hypothetical protein
MGGYFDHLLSICQFNHEMEDDESAKKVTNNLVDHNAMRPVLICVSYPAWHMDCIIFPPLYVLLTFIQSLTYTKSYKNASSFPYGTVQWNTFIYKRSLKNNLIINHSLAPISAPQLRPAAALFIVIHKVHFPRPDCPTRHRTPLVEF